MATATFLVIILAVGGFLAWKAGLTLDRITKGDISFLKNVYQMLPVTASNLKGEEEGRINLAILGMRGENVPGGGKLADTIMIVSVKPQENKAAIVSIPRDLYVAVPGTNSQQKINSVYHYGEEKRAGGGLEDMSTILHEVTGLPIHYAAAINFEGFKKLVDAIGGVSIILAEPFSEPLQFNEPHPCDPYVFTLPNGKYTDQPVVTSVKHGVKNYSKTIRVPLCTNPDKECGGNFSLSAGVNNLNGNQALCYARSRVTSNDFERAKRQQEILKAVKDKMVSLGTLTDFTKINDLLDAVGTNVKTNLEVWEIKEFFTLYQEMPNPEIKQKVFDNSEEGLLYSPQITNGAGYILLPRGDSYDRIHQTMTEILN